jgi:puromycin-sensitive aminopeptidase
VKGGWVDKRLLLGEAETRVELPAAPEWVLANTGGHGFFRVGYALPMLRKLARSVAKVSPIDRFNVASDAFALSQAGVVPAVEYLDLTGRFREERDRNVWMVLTGSFGFLNRVLPDRARPGLEAFVRHRVGLATARLGWDREEGESELVRQLRGDLLRVLGTLGNDEETQAQARAMWARYVEDESALDPNVLPAVIAILASTGGEREYGDFHQRFRTARNPQEEQRYLYALGAFREPALIKQTLERTLNGEVRSQDAPFLIRSMLGSVYARALAWEFVKEHWEAMARQYPGSAYRRLYEGVTMLVSPDWERDVRDFFERNKITLGGKTLEQYLEQLSVAVRFQEREATALSAYLARPPR